LNYSSVSYGGVVAHKLELKADEIPPSTPPEIPGYNLLALLGVSAFVGVSIVFIKKYKKLQKEV